MPSQSSPEARRSDVPLAPARRSRLSSLIVLMALGLVIVGFRLEWIRRYGLSLPFWDEWISVVPKLILPWLEGRLQLGDLFTPHNEHRIVFTRLLYLAQLQLNGQWDALAGMVFDAVFHTATGLILIVLLSKGQKRSLRAWIAFWVVLLWSLPFGWQNALWSLQSQFYFLVFFSVLGMWGLALHRAFSLRWWLGVGCLFCACFSMASGLLASLVLTAFLLYFLIVESEGRRKLVPSLVVCGIVLVLSAVLFESPEHHQALRAAGPLAFLRSLSRGLAWPYIDTPLVCLVLYFPFATVLLRMVWTRHRPSKDEKLVLILAGWVVLTVAAAAFSRGKDGRGPSVRYFDLLVLGPLANFCCFGILARPWVGLPKRMRRVLPLLAGGWSIVFLAGLALLVFNVSFRQMEEKHNLSKRQLANCRQYLLSGDLASLEGKAKLEVPHPRPERLAQLLEHPLLRTFLPLDLAVPNFLAGEEDPFPAFTLNGLPPMAGEYRGEDVLGSYGRGLGDRSVGHFVSKPFFARLPYLRIPLAGYLGREGLSLYVVEEHLRETDFHLYEFDLPPGPLTDLQIAPANEPCSIALESIELLLDDDKVSIPVAKPHALQLNRSMSYVGSLGSVGLYRADGSAAAFSFRQLAERDLAAEKQARVRVKMWISNGSTMRVKWNTSEEPGLPTELTQRTIPAVAKSFKIQKDRLGTRLIEGNARQVVPEIVAKESWMPYLVEAPGRVARLVAIDNRTDCWFAFAMPREFGVLSYFSAGILHRSRGLIMVGALLWLLAVSSRLFGGFREAGGR